MTKEIVVNVDERETRVAVLEDGVVMEFFIERYAGQQLVGNIYKGVVENVLPGMQAAFVNVGLEKNVFLYITDILPPTESSEDGLDVSPETLKPIEEVIHPGQEIIVQIIREPIGNKGARASTHVTLPGRYLVLMPTLNLIRVSRRIEDEAERERLISTAKELNNDEVGVIIRTVAEGKDKDDLAKDLQLLKQVWYGIASKSKKQKAPCILHRDLDLILRIIRDQLTDDITGFIIDDKEKYQQVLELLDSFAPHLKSKVKLYNEATDIFTHFGVETEIDKILERKVWLKSGGYLVIDQTEALTCIDVNTGKFIGSTNLADTVLQTNLEAIKEIARQLRLRDIGGIIIIDFIDMLNKEDQEKILVALDEELKRDKTKTNVFGLTQLGLVEMTRKKVKQGLENFLQKTCPCCKGKGKVVTEETINIRLERKIIREAKDALVEALVYAVNPYVHHHLLKNLSELQAKVNKKVLLIPAEDVLVNELKLVYAGNYDGAEKLLTK